MASCDDGVGKDNHVDENTDPSHTDEFSPAVNPIHGEYVHNPEEFIDIHGTDNSLRTNTSKVEKSNCELSSNLDKTDVKERSVNPPPSSSNADVSSHSTFRFGAETDLKVPVQVSDENTDETHIKKLNASDESNDEYESAEDGDEDEDSQDDDFVPLGDEDSCQGIDDSRGAFSNTDNTCQADESDDIVRNAVENEEESGGEQTDTENKEPEPIDELEVRKKEEELLSDEEKQERKEKSQQLKDEGNKQFRNGDYDDAITSYSEALEICPLNFLKERSIMFSNRAACKMKQELYEDAIKDSSSALELHPHYVKAILRRAELYEKTEKLDEALKDYQKVVELDPSQNGARVTCMRLAEQIRDRNEKMKEEMMGKLKDLGNLVLRPFGLSTNNFNLQQDPNTGSYSVQFQQNPPKNGS